jgi:hypothetical protein
MVVVHRNGIFDHVDLSRGHGCVKREPTNSIWLEARAGVHAGMAACDDGMTGAYGSS